MSVIVKHPTLNEVEQSVDEADLDRWKAAGWIAPEAPVELADFGSDFDDDPDEVDAAEVDDL